MKKPKMAKIEWLKTAKSYDDIPENWRDVVEELELDFWLDDINRHDNGGDLTLWNEAINRKNRERYRAAREIYLPKLEAWQERNMTPITATNLDPIAVLKIRKHEVDKPTGYFKAGANLAGQGPRMERKEDSPFDAQFSWRGKDYQLLSSLTTKNTYTVGGVRFTDKPMLITDIIAESTFIELAEKCLQIPMHPRSYRAQQHNNGFRPHQYLLRWCGNWYTSFTNCRWLLHWLTGLEHVRANEYYCGVLDRVVKIKNAHRLHPVTKACLTDRDSSWWYTDAMLKHIGIEAPTLHQYTQEEMEEDLIEEQARIETLERNQEKMGQAIQDDYDFDAEWARIIAEEEAEMARFLEEQALLDMEELDV